MRRAPGVALSIPQAQGKLSSVVLGMVLDVLVNVRIGSPTFEEWMKFTLFAENQRQPRVPKGFSYGLVAMGEVALFSYKCAHYHHREVERSPIRGNLRMGSDWPTGITKLSVKDATAARFAEFTAENPPRYVELSSNRNGW